MKIGIIATSRFTDFPASDEELLSGLKGQKEPKTHFRQALKGM